MTPRARTWAIVGVAAAAVGVGGLIGWTLDSARLAAPPAATSSPAPVAGTPSPTPPAAIPTSFASAQDLVETLSEQGLPCGTPTRVPNPSLAISLVDCGPSIVVGVYATHDDALGAYQALTSMSGRTFQVHMAIGYDWTVSADDASYAKQVAIKFGVPYFATD